MSPALRQFIFFLVLLAVPLTSFFLVFKPQNTDIANAKREIEHKEEMLEKLRDATSQTEDLQDANEEIRKRIETIEARLPSNKEMDNVLREVWNLAREQELRVPEFRKSDKPIRAGDAMEQPIDIKISGNFDGFYQFLLTLEQLPRVTRITDLQIVRARDKDGDMEAQFKVSIYYQGETTSS